MQDPQIDQHVEDFKEIKGFLKEIKTFLKKENNIVCIKLNSSDKFELVLNINKENNTVSFFNYKDGFYTKDLNKIHKTVLEEILFYFKNN